MKKLLAFVVALLLNTASQAASYSFSWCPVKGAQQYAVCTSTSGMTIYYGEQTSQFGTPPCNGVVTWVTGTSTTVNLPSNGWVQVLAEAVLLDHTTYTVSFVYSGYSYPATVTAGLTPPVIGGCP